MLAAVHDSKADVFKCATLPRHQILYCYPWIAMRGLGWFRALKIHARKVCRVLQNVKDGMFVGM